MIPFLSLHVIAAQRGDGLHPLLLAGLKRISAEHGDGDACKAWRELMERAEEPIADCTTTRSCRAGARLSERYRYLIRSVFTLHFAEPP
jgi:hypothetical protein